MLYLIAASAQTFLQGFIELIIDFGSKKFPFPDSLCQFFPQRGILGNTLPEGFIQCGKLFGNGIIGFGKVIALFHIDGQIFFQGSDLTVQKNTLIFKTDPVGTQFFQFCTGFFLSGAQKSHFIADLPGIFFRRKFSGTQSLQLSGNFLKLLTEFFHGFFTRSGFLPRLRKLTAHTFQGRSILPDHIRGGFLQSSILPSQLTVCLIQLIFTGRKDLELFFQFIVGGRTFPVGTGINTASGTLCIQQLLQLPGPGCAFALLILQRTELKTQCGKLFIQLITLPHQTADLLHGTVGLSGIGPESGKFRLKIRNLFPAQFIFFGCPGKTQLKIPSGSGCGR